MTLLSCSAEHIEQLKKYGVLLQNFLREYEWLLDAYILDFYTENYWDKLPQLWRFVLDEIDPEELSHFISKESQCTYRKPWPLSLQAFRIAAHALSWQRTPVAFNVAENILKTQILPKNATSLNECHSRTDSCDKKSHSGPKCFGETSFARNVFRRHVKPKKQHEIDQCAKVASVLLRFANCRHVVDVGAGQGHLSRLLAIGYGFEVVTLEAESCHITGARKFDKQASCELLKKLSTEMGEHNWLVPEHVEYRLTSDSTSCELKKVLSETWIKCTTNGMPRFGIIGLHTCGNLAATILRKFVDMEKASALLSVGCCYMKLDSDGFPMSVHLKNAKLSYQAKEIACHALEMYAEKLSCKDEAEKLKIHCFRGILEKLIVEKYPERKHMGLKSIRHAKNMTFSSYVEKALADLPINVPSESVTSQYVQTAVEQWKRVVVFYTLRLLLAPVAESLILLDRMLFLQEKGVSSCLLPMFDPLLSPRNHLLLAIKTSTL